MADEVRPISEENRQWLVNVESHLENLLCHAFGNVSLTRTETDLPLLQRAIDEGVVQAGDELELQCLGTALGNVFVQQTEMEWSEVSNEYGDMLAIHAPRILFTLYPITMISQRVEDGREVNVKSLYDSFVLDLDLRHKRG